MNILKVMIIERISVAGIEILNIQKFLELLFRFILNLGVILVLVRWLYYSKTKRKDYLFTYILIASLVFLLCYLLESVSLQIGFALGLFAIFGIIRYRTNAIPIKEMTYLFLIIGISVINALTSTNTSLTSLLFSNVIIIVITFGLEKVWLLKHESSKLIIYEKINLIREGSQAELIKDLEERTGIGKINRVEVGKINFLRDICELKIYYYENKENGLNGNGIEFAEKDDDDDD